MFNHCCDENQNSHNVFVHFENVSFEFSNSGPFLSTATEISKREFDSNDTDLKLTVV